MASCSAVAAVASSVLPHKHPTPSCNNVMKKYFTRRFPSSFSLTSLPFFLLLSLSFPHNTSPLFSSTISLSTSQLAFSWQSSPSSSSSFLCPSLSSSSSFSFFSSSSYSSLSSYFPLFSPPSPLLFAGAAVVAPSPTGQRMVSPVPPVAVAGRDRQALPTFAALLEAASTQEFSIWLQKVRRELHAWPELMFQEHRTSALVHLVLEALHIPFTKGWGSDTLEMHATAAAQQRAMKNGTGIIAHVGTGAEPCIALRADMDALPVTEKVDIPFRSKRENMMHACGHDVHVTLLLGAAALLKAIEPQLKGTVRLIFQPAEEGGAGARCMREEGVLQMFPPARLVFGHHVDPSLPTGVIATRQGVLMAGVSNFTIEIEGRGGHAAYPRDAVDAAPAVAAILQGIYAIGSREISFSEKNAGLITITKIHGGSALNVIPTQYELGGTIRALSPEMLIYLEQRLYQLAEHIASAFRCTCRIRMSPRKYPPVLNDPQTTEFYQRVMAHASASGKVEEAKIHMGGEDFAFFLEEVPGTFAFIGIGSGAQVPGQPRSDYSLHSDLFAVDERILSYGAAIEAYLALEALQHLQEEQEKNRQKEEIATQGHSLFAVHAAAQAAAQAAAVAAARAVEEESVAEEIRRRQTLAEMTRRAAVEKLKEEEEIGNQTAGNININSSSSSVVSTTPGVHRAGRGDDNVAARRFSRKEEEREEEKESSTRRTQQPGKAEAESTQNVEDKPAAKYKISHGEEL